MNQKCTQEPSHRSSTPRTLPPEHVNKEHNRRGVKRGGVEYNENFKRECRDAPGQNCLYITSGMHNEEHYRLATFSKYPNDVLAKVADMAAAGFYYSGFKDRIKCFSCGISVENWMACDDGIHKKWHKSDCRLVTGADAYNKPLPTSNFRTLLREYEGLNNFTLTRNTNIAQKNHHVVIASLPVCSANNALCAEEVTPMENVTSNMANFQLNEINYPPLQIANVTTPEHKSLLLGLSLQNEEDRRIVKNLSSGNISMTDSQRRVADEADRVRINALCSAETNGEPLNPSSEEQQQIAVHFPCSRPTNPHMESLEARIASFDSEWPGLVLPSKEHFARAGFYFVGQSAEAKCFYCNGGLQNWDPEDEPWTEHAKWFPGCKYRICQKGVDFVRNLKEAHPNLSRPYIRNSVSYDIPPTAGVQHAHKSQSNKSTTSSRLNINQILSMGFSSKQMDNIIQRKRGGYNTTEELLNDLLEENVETPSPSRGPISIVEETVHAQSIAAIVGTKQGVGTEKTRISSPSTSFSTEVPFEKVQNFKAKPWTEDTEEFLGKGNKGEDSTTETYYEPGDQPNMAVPWPTVYFDRRNLTNTLTADTSQQLELPYLNNVVSSEHNLRLRSLNLQIEAERRRSFINWPLYLASHLPDQLSRNGFFYLGNGDRIECVSCRATLSSWPTDECEYGMHRLHLQECTFGENSRNI